jgi:hypothetical protein
MIRVDSIQISPQLLAILSELDEFKGAWRALGTLAPDRLLALRRIATIESVGSSTRLEGVTQLPRYPLEPLLQAARANECPARREPPRDPSVPFLEALNLVGYSNRIDSRRIRHELEWTPRVSYQRALAVMQTAVAA